VSIPRFGWLCTPVLGFVMAATPSHEAAPSAVDLERNRQLLQKWKTDPEHYARLQQDLHDFWTLPKAKREHLRQLDREFHELDDTTRKRLGKTAERYLAWLERLSEEERQHIEAAADWHEKLSRIEAIREKRWIERAPRKVREELAKLPPDERTARVTQLRKQERQQRKQWQRPLSIGPRPVKPLTHLSDFSPEVQEFVKKQLLPRLNAEERKQYHQAEGRPGFAFVVKHLAERHPVLPPLHRSVTRYEELPVKAKGIAGAKIIWERRIETWKKLQQVEGIWPEWAEMFVSLLPPQQRKAMPPLGACHPHDFSADIQTFIKTSLKAKVKPAEMHKLKEAEGKWPAYPIHLLKLAHDHNLQVPGMSLPGSAELWENNRK
jgi:hypothetical protein